MPTPDREGGVHGEIVMEWRHAITCRIRIIGTGSALPWKLSLDMVRKEEFE
jgi:hypothetical protein